MSDDLPTPERQRRIEQGVQRRIDLRRLVARRIAGGSVAVVLVVGGFALLPRFALSTGGGASGGSAAGSSSSVPVVCRDRGGATVQAERSGLPRSAIAACAAEGRPAAVRPATASEGVTDETAPSPSPTPAGVLCRADDGSLEVSLSATTTCTDLGLQDWPG